MSRFANAAPPRWLVAAFLCFNFPLSALQPAQERNGFPLHPPDLRSRLLQALADKGSGYEPRTEHLEPNGSPRYTNRLILEQSPYLIQHAHNPVNWYPWSDEAFERARLENKPVFLSIGYSTCHWCHVMERESFDNEEIAELLNEKFICIKVDREQRPDLDEIYMTAVQLLTRHGGWPMSSFLTPDAKTFYGGTYYPQATFLRLLEQVNDGWTHHRGEVVAQANELAEAVQAATSRARGAERVRAGVVGTARVALLARRDREHGGLGGAPKFPQAPKYMFLIDQAYRRHDAELLDAIRFDLHAMSRGGIYDQVGGGFHRYATDDLWRVPHFEKMLYTQAQLARVYFEAWRLTGDPALLRVSRQTLDYVLRDMRSPEGGFYSATDADSEGGEGRFFLWAPGQLDAVLEPADAALAKALFGVTDTGNFEGSNILFLSDSLARYAEQTNEPLAELLVRVDRIRERLYQARELRPHPIRDEKIITAWNAMMICALATAGAMPGGETYRQAALEAGEFLWRKNRNQDGTLWRVRLDGRSSISATLDDYAWLANAYVSLYDISLEIRWLQRAEDIIAAMNRRFRDPDNGGYFINGEDDNTPAMARPKIGRDGAEPGGNAVALSALAKLERRPTNHDHRDSANGLIAAFATAINRHPSSYAYLLRGTELLSAGETGPHQYGARGALRADASMVNGKIRVTIDIEPGWHINAHRPLSQDLIPTTLSLRDADRGWRLGDVSYPQPVEKSLGFSDMPLALYEDHVELTAELVDAGSPAATGGVRTLPINLQLQACDRDLCLPPETLTLQIGADVRRR